MRRAVIGSLVAALLLVPGLAEAGAGTKSKCRKVPSGSTYDVSFQTRSFRNGATGTHQLWRVDGKGGRFFISGKLLGGSAQGRIATWGGVPRPDGEKFAWSNAEARTYSIFGIATPDHDSLDIRNGSKEAKLSRTCARRNHA
jgi:hypothetical protein